MLISNSGYREWGCYRAPRFLGSVLPGGNFAFTGRSQRVEKCFAECFYRGTRHIKLFLQFASGWLVGRRRTDARFSVLRGCKPFILGNIVSTVQVKVDGAISRM